MSKRKIRECCHKPIIEHPPQDVIYIDDEPESFCFVSHSGAQKQFAELLCRDLEAAGICNFPFFDRESDSPAKGEASGKATVQVARDCGIGVMLISEEFFTESKWPMLELLAMKVHRCRVRIPFVSAARILPVYYRLNISDFMHYKRQEHWIEMWKTMAITDPRIELSSWIETLAGIVKHAGVHICLSQRIISDKEGRRIIVNRIHDHINGLAQGSSVRRDDPSFPLPTAFRLPSFPVLPNAPPPPLSSLLGAPYAEVIIESRGESSDYGSLSRPDLPVLPNSPCASRPALSSPFAAYYPGFTFQFRSKSSNSAAFRLPNLLPNPGPPAPPAPPSSPPAATDASLRKDKLIASADPVQRKGKSRSSSESKEEEKIENRGVDEDNNEEGNNEGGDSDDEGEGSPNHDAPSSDEEEDGEDNLGRLAAEEAVAEDEHPDDDDDDEDDDDDGEDKRRRRLHQ